MKKILLSLGAACLLAVGAQAQVSYGIKAGVNLGKYATSSSGDEVELDDEGVKLNPSFYVTGYADINVAPNFSIQPGISLQGKGQKAKIEEEGASFTSTRNVMSIEIPVNAVYYIPTGDAGSVFLGAGPYVGYAISGKDKWKGTFEGETETEDDKIDFSGDDKDMKAFDAGVNFLAGYKLANGFLINVGYGLGLTNLAPDNDFDIKSSNRVLSFGVGFQF
ncbi:PorT family protein [Sphingobacterium sp. SGG-5]|uniref:porin family protein n=1 Tax=Sphingobacterium sp. SGG-5 TaxID=2710881 RepID=UPI0013EA931C|nr:porin family protein [Sphingobacterium sp. SGG-5]NGM63075.1 PorT family protein [Sphingobacterium sp. SGG-5]